MWTRAVILGALGFAAGGAVGCAEERPPINKVQANALAKTFFVGANLQDPIDDPEFYAQGTVIDVGYGAAQDGLFTSTYAQPVSRIKWTIQENLLIGRLTYERIANSDGKGVGPASSDGVVVVAYPITSHFDIKRDYNPTTGEESNVIVENTSDRPWNQREYMRVDWSRNLNVDSYDFDTLSMIGVYGGVTYEPLAYYVNDPSDVNAPHFDAETGYFDVTNKAFATPQMIDLSHLGWGIDKFPACMLPADFAGGTGPSGNCNPVELTIRQSFKRVVETDYEPADYDGLRFQAFGAFTTDRMGYTRNYGMTDSAWHRFIDRYNIWDKSHFYFPEDHGAHKKGDPLECYTAKTTPHGADPHRDMLPEGEKSDQGESPVDSTRFGNGTEDECALVEEITGVNGSRCDTFKQRCTLPYQSRVEKPIVWYYANGSDPEFFDGTEWATHEWDIAMRGAVQTAKYAECVRGANWRKSPDDRKARAEECAAKFPMYSGQMDENWDARELAREVDDCRNGLAYKELGRNEASCTALADKIGGERSYSSGVIAVAKMPEMVVLCHSPVEAGDPVACAPADKRLPSDTTSADCAAAQKGRLDPATASDANKTLAKCGAAVQARRGDMRYNQVNAIPEPQTPSPWGIMVDSDDPLTGEKIATSVNVWTYVNNLWSQGVIDQIRYIKGELQTEDITNGAYIHNWTQAYDASQRTGATGTVSGEEFEQKMADFVGLDPKMYADAKTKQLPPGVAAKLAELRAALKGVKADARQPSTSAPIYAARRKLAQGTAFEAELVRSPQMQQFAGVGADGAPLSTDAVIEMASPLRRSNPTVEREFRNRKELALAQRGACILQEAPAPFSMVGLADLLEEKFGAFNPKDDAGQQQARAEKMRRFLAQRAQFAVIAHEMGHSIGHRHNFISSYDAWGYRPQYWQLRTRDGKVTDKCETAQAKGEDCIGPRYFDPVTENESDNLIWAFMQSSVMDYAGEATQDLIGIGPYDYAAARMFYGDVVAVHKDASYKASTSLGRGMLSVTDNFGGITGLTPPNPRDCGPNNACDAGLTCNKDYGLCLAPGESPDKVMQYRYPELQKDYSLIGNCREVDPYQYKPAAWNAERDGAWHPLLDGLIVKVDGKYTRCDQQQVDYQQWTALRMPNGSETQADRYRGGSAVDVEGRTRVPYGFATDNWADLGNLSVYRHDNGADPYELFNFMIQQQELNHIFDNFRRGRNGFSVRSAANRTLSRYNEKMRDGAKGLGLYANIYRELAVQVGYDFNALWAQATSGFLAENVFASGIAFDHFARQLARPEAGLHYLVSGDPVLRSAEDRWYNDEPPNSTAGNKKKVTIPNGVSGYWANGEKGTGNIGFGGRPIENRLADDKGDYNSSYTMNAGSYYDKLYTSMLLTESVDNFISSSRSDFVDARYRSVSMADLFPDGYRRWLANNLTGDDFIKGPRMVADSKGNPLKDDAGYPLQAIGWTSWWNLKGPTSCFPAEGTNVCSSYSDGVNNPLNPLAPPHTVVIDPQIGWEQQKFLIAWTLMYLPENAKQFWLNQMQIYELGVDADPGFENRIEFHDPSGKVYVARTFGKEILFGKTVQKGVGARVLEWANTLLEQGYETTPGPDLDGDSQPDWYEPVVVGGRPIVAGCSPADESCKCETNRACVQLGDYTAVPYFIRQAMSAYGLDSPKQKGVY
jgi:hypothetical protein